MFNSGSKKRALEALQSAIKEYEDTSTRVTLKSEEVYRLRQTTLNIIQACENYITTLISSPRKLKKTVAVLKAKYGRFSQPAQEVGTEIRKHFATETEFEARDLKKESGFVTGADIAARAGVAAGVGVAAFGPSAAMAIATTFGTASTGTAISALSGAAATSAATAWLGGGAIVAGGGGMALGGTLLAATGPVGLGIIAATTIAHRTSRENAEQAKKAEQETTEFISKTAQLKEVEREVDELLQLTHQHTSAVWKQLNNFTTTAPKDYYHFTAEQKEALDALISNIQALSNLLGDVPVSEETVPIIVVAVAGLIIWLALKFILPQ
jgi:hypothetical protein